MVIFHGYVSLPKGLTIELLQIFRKKYIPHSYDHHTWSMVRNHGFHPINNDDPPAKKKVTTLEAWLINQSENLYLE